MAIRSFSHPGADLAGESDQRVCVLAAAQARAPDFSPRLLEWHATYGRHDLPWQTPDDPYRVWLSEVMLQQTQVATVRGYYARFLERFPTVHDLARAPLDAVLTAWAGLGYYSRARNLHRCAQVVVDQHEGRFPSSAARLVELPGIGPSTAAAIAAFCFQERAAILDGNVKRVLGRLLAYGGDLSDKRCERELWSAACELLPPERRHMPGYTQALMDLGATVCTPRRPACADCPVRPLCAAARQGQPEAFPVKRRRLVRKQRESWWLWLQCADAIWLEQRPPVGIWGGLWSLPIFDEEAVLAVRLANLSAQLGDDIGRGVEVEALGAVEHALTHFDWRLHPWRVRLPQAARQMLASVPDSVQPGGRWVSMGELTELGLPAPLRRLLDGR